MDLFHDDGSGLYWLAAVSPRRSAMAARKNIGQYSVDSREIGGCHGFQKTLRGVTRWVSHEAIAPPPIAPPGSMPARHSMDLV